MKKVLYITTVSRTINAFLVPHIEMLLENGYEVDIACSIDKEVNKGLLEKGVKIFEVPFSLFITPCFIYFYYPFG